MRTAECQKASEGTGPKRHAVKSLSVGKGKSAEHFHQIIGRGLNQKQAFRNAARRPACRSHTDLETTSSRITTRQECEAAEST
ncbi:hypothetical protein RRG08_012584 [Elysia crispata]|uniref:Uncharacterized protein n=1 Tax=Elysia crispata TaxID=231223 RepID=A0AAE1AIC0_9GAST|nr:hypothetical protein RRG08_012584 [Elysia crispata]